MMKIHCSDEEISSFLQMRLGREDDAVGPNNGLNRME